MNINFGTIDELDDFILCSNNKLSNYPNKSDYITN